MEYNLKKTSIGTLQTCIDTVSEQPVDIDFTLPDYCPDIEKILRCKITPKIYNRNISGGQIQVDGTTVVTILYVDGENNNLRACEQSVPFSVSLQAKGLCENNVIEINTKAEYVNCRALSRRRLAVHGAFSLYVKAVTLDSVSLYSPEDNEKIECDLKEVKATALTSLSQSQFTICDEISVGNKPDVEIILSSDVKANIVDYKVVSEKLMLNGELCVKLLYLSEIEKGEPQQLDYIVPFSQIIDCENLSDDGVTCVSLNVMCFDIHLKSDMLSEKPIISVDAKLSASVYGYNDITATVINDAYSTEFVTEYEQSNLALITDVNYIKDTFMQKESVSLDDMNISSICDISCDSCMVTPTINLDGISLNTKVNISILAFDEEKTPVYLQRSIDFVKNIELNFNFNNIVNANCTLASLSYRIGEQNTLELRCELKYCITTNNQDNLMIITKISALEDSVISKSPCALTLYYASEGEKLWDIAKKYSTKLNLLYEENNLDCTVLEKPQMLLIPMV